MYMWGGEEGGGVVIPISSTILTFFPITSTHILLFRLLGYFHIYAAYSRSQWWYKPTFIILYGKHGNQAKQPV